jgi:hypothetical protein
MDAIDADGAFRRKISAIDPSANRETVAVNLSPWLSMSKVSDARRFGRR